MSPRFVLYVEDEEADRVLMEHAFQGMEAVALKTVRDGQQAIDYLSGRGHYADRTLHPAPAFILLDLKMPRLSGMDVLRWLRRQPEWTDVPVAVYSSSLVVSDVRDAMAAGADHYLVKPADIQRMRAVVHAIAQAHTLEPPDFALLARLPECKGNRSEPGRTHPPSTDLRYD